MSGLQVEGLVLKNYGGFYYVQDDEGKIYECKLRGKIKIQVLSGDRVVISLLEPGKGVLEEVLPRNSELYRPKIANVTLLLIVMTNNQPAPSLYLLDRLLFLAYYNNLSPYIILNKYDLKKHPNAAHIENYYPSKGFKVIRTSATKKIGIEAIKEVISGQIAVFAGPSGAGKSSLLNTLLEDVNIKTQEVSKKIGRGRHTTRHVELFSLPGGGYIADTPGFSTLDMPNIESREISNYFPDFSEYINECKFNDCLHFKEKGCRVQQAVSEGNISEFRYNNYLSMLEEVRAKERCF